MTVQNKSIFRLGSRTLPFSVIFSLLLINSVGLAHTQPVSGHSSLQFDENASRGASLLDYLDSKRISVDFPLVSTSLQIDPIALESFADDLFSEKTLNDFKVPGIVVTFVQDNKIILSKGYGVASLSSSEEIDPNRTIFLAGSISKSFVATAVMQLYEQGVLNLSADINDYLTSFQIPTIATNQSITMHHLLTHTAGFDELWDVVTDYQSEIKPLAEFLASKLPSRIFYPGEVINYSNFGYALAGYIVELLAGCSFDEYVKVNILEPLGMNSSGFEQPIPLPLLPNAAQGYYLENDSTLVPLDPFYFDPYPAGSLYTTGNDMAKFMLAHLNNGTYNNHRILNATTIQYMHERQFAHHPQLEGFCYGFYEASDGNTRAIRHGGDLGGFSSDMLLFPEHKLGYFISQNGVGTGLREVLAELLFKEFFPSTPPPLPQPTDDFVERMNYYKGTYWYTRYPHERFEEYKDMLPLMSLKLSVNKTSNTLITNITTSSQSGLVEWVEIEPFLFQSNEANTKLALRLVDGKIKYVFLGLSAFERHDAEITSTDSTGFGWISLIMSLLILLIARLGKNEKRH